MVVLQKDEVDKSKKDLQLLEQKYTQQQNKLKAAQADVDKAKDALANLPAMPENTKPQQDALQAQIKDLHNQVLYCPGPKHVSHLVKAIQGNMKQSHNIVKLPVLPGEAAPVTR